MALEASAARAWGVNPPAPLLSILVPVYNVAPWLEECVRSILSQDRGEGEVEVILLDDASTDGSGTLARRLAESDPSRVTFMAHAVNQGLSAARNSMLARARGRHIWFVDSDDRLMPGALSTLLGILRRHAPDVVICDYSKNGKCDHAGFAGPAWTLERDRDALLRGVFQTRRLHAWLKIWRRDLWGHDLRFPPGRVYEDVATTPTLLLRAQSYFYVPQPWVFYRWRPGSILTSVRGGRFDARKHDDLVHALTGLGGELARALPDMSEETRFRVAHFVAKEFTKIGYRLIRHALRQPDLRRVDPIIRQYCLEFDQRSPIPFHELARLYRRQGMPIAAMVLRYFLFRARAPYLVAARAA